MFYNFLSSDASSFYKTDIWTSLEKELENYRAEVVKIEQNKIFESVTLIQTEQLQITDFSFFGKLNNKFAWNQYQKVGNCKIIYFELINTFTLTWIFFGIVLEFCASLCIIAHSFVLLKKTNVGLHSFFG